MAEHDEIDCGEETSGGCPESDPDCLTTGDMARLSNTTLRTVRFYEQEGLISSMAREGGCHRKFGRAELKKLQIITDLREAGLSLQEIKALAALKRRCSSPTAAAQAMSQALCSRIEDLKARIDTLSRVREELASTVATIKRCH
ncbi:MAG TPA: MerR family transcriptional regulator, partial [Polyangiales bacterium]|nr:MerR family transcriptional regulator [Polyangiales bacterium]